MVIKRSASAQVGRLLQQLLGDEVLARDTAAARLVILGPRSIPHLAALLTHDLTETQAIGVLGVLERVEDARVAALATPLLSDTRDGVAGAALAVVRKGLASEDADTASSALQALLRTATETSNRPVLARMALDALGDLPEAVLKPLRMAAPDVATSPESVNPVGGSDPAQQFIRSWLDGDAVESQPDQLRVALEAAGGVAPLSMIHSVVQRARQFEEQAGGSADQWRSLRGLAHQVLSGRGSRVALYDLRETLARQPGRLTVGMLGALAVLADRSDLDALGAAWAGGDDAWLTSQIEDVCRAVVLREGLDFRHGAGRQVATRHPALVEHLSRTSQTTPSRRRSSRT